MSADGDVSRPRPGGVPVRRRGALAPTLAILAALLIAVLSLAGFWTDVLWYSQLGYVQVLRTRLVTQALLFVGAAVITAGAVYASMAIAYRSRPIYAPVASDSSLDRYRDSVEPIRRTVTVVVPLFFALFTASAAAQQWQTVLLWLNRGPFGMTDKQFGRDVSFFVFTLPWLQFLVGFAMSVVVLAALVGGATHYLYGGIRVQGPGPRVTSAARLHLSILGALFLLLRAADSWLSRYALTTKTNDLMTGLSYTDANATLNARAVMAALSVLVALIVLAAVFVPGWRQVPVYGVVLLVISSIVVGDLYPAAIERFRVNPNKRDLEQTYIARNIEATREAYGLDTVQVQQYSAKTESDPAALRNNVDLVPGIRLLDPSLVGDTFEQLQQSKQYYQFPDSLDVDRYVIDGVVRDSVVAVRELKLSGIPADKRNWVNEHLIYTHGYGFVAAFGNETTQLGDPKFFQSGIPVVGSLPEFEPRVYFGEYSPDYSIVGGAKELDYPDDASPTKEATYTYAGDGGVALGSLWRRLLYAVAFRDQNILISDAVNERSRIMYERDPVTRIEQVAPFLTLDGDPYPSVVDGRIVWIVDGYTSTNRYPYSAMSSLRDETTDSLTQRSGNVSALADERVNYIRNSVKATVDAYDGSVTLYTWDEEDPILAAWKRIFPGAVKPLSTISSQLMSHLRYPEDLFKVQRALLARYHVTDPLGFFTGGDYWQVPPEPNSPSTAGQTPATVAAPTTIKQPPFYLSIQMPGTNDPSYSLTSTFIPPPGGRNVLKGFLAVDADAGSQAGKRREGYGTMRLLQMNTDAIKGPGQMQNDFNTNVDVTRELNTLRISGGATRVENGNLLTLPLAGGLIYVQPVYVRGTGETSYPLLQRVLVGFGQKIGFGPTLDAALTQVFGASAGVGGGTPGGGGGGTPAATPSVSPSPGASPSAAPSGSAQAQLDTALQDARQAIADSEAALAKQDFAAYGAAQQRLKDAVGRAITAQGTLGVTSSSATTAPSPAPSASPTP